MRSHQLVKFLPPITSPLRGYSFLRQPTNKKTTPSLNNHIPAREISSAAATGLTYLWIATGLTAAHRTLEFILDEELYNGPYHPWFGTLVTATLATIFVLKKHDYDKNKEYADGIFKARISSDINALPDFFKDQLNNPNNESKDFYLLVQHAQKTNTLEILLESAHDLDPKLIKKIFYAVKDFASGDLIIHQLLNCARNKNISIDENPSPRPGN